MQRRREQGWSRAAAELASALRGGEPLGDAPLRALLDELGRRPPGGAWHPTGFVVLELLRGDEGALRLHLWPAGAREQGRPCWPVHDHMWHLRSQVLCGEVHSLDYDVDDDPCGDSVLYEVEYGEGRRSCMRRSERRVRVRPRPPRRIGAGGRYGVEAGEFHASRVEPQGFAATLVATQPTSRPRPRVIGPADGPPTVQVERSAVDPVLVHTLVARVGTQLGRAERTAASGGDRARARP